MQERLINIRLRLPESIYRALRHVAVDDGVAVSELLEAAAKALLERKAAGSTPGETNN